MEVKCLGKKPEGPVGEGRWSKNVIGEKRGGQQF